MPGFDGTGPYGTYISCMPTKNAPYADRRRGFGAGRGFGRGRMYNPRGLLRPRFVDAQPISQEEELGILEQQEKELSQNLKGLAKRIEELKKGK